MEDYNRIMLTDKEIKKIIEAQKEVFSTKTDFESFKKTIATKADLESFKNTFATKEDFESFKNKIVAVVATKDDVNEIKKDLDGLRESVQALTISVDGLVNSKSGVDQENTMIVGKVERHDKWISKVAPKIGVPLEY